MSSWVLLALFMVLLNITTNNLTNARHTWYEKPNEFCYADTEHPYLYFSSKTAYDAVYYKSDAETIPSECKPRQIWMLIRHGTRYPLKRKMEAFQELTRIRDEIVKNHDQNKGSLCNKDIENLKKWTFEKIPLSQSDQLTKQGYDDLRTIGDRTWRRFHELFKHSYSKKHYTVQYTRHVKTKDSAEAFSRGLFGKHIHIDPPKDDDLLQQIYPQCKVLPLPGADDPPDAGRKERSLFKEGPLVHEVIRNVSRRLGFDKPLSVDDVDNMYDMCRYKKSWKFDELSPWCACFLDKEFQILEYVGDLSYYYNSGHGYSANLRTGCPLVQDMIFRFRDIATNPHTEEPYGVFYFGHSTTIYNLVARLGVLKDPVRLTHENFYNVTNRKWHTSSIAPFSGNFAAVMLKCHTGSENRVVFFHHERPFKFNGCQGYVCSWDMLENMYKNITDPSTCNYDFCSKDDETTESETEKSTTQTMKKDEVDEETTTSFINSSSTTTTTERSNGIVQGRYDNYNPERSRNRVLHRKVTQVVSVQEISKESIVNDPEPMISRETHFDDDTEDLEAPYGTYKPKTKWTNKEIRLSWLFISFFVCVVILVICNRYSNKKKQIKMLRVGYDRMSNIHLRDIQDKF